MIRKFKVNFDGSNGFRSEVFEGKDFFVVPVVAMIGDSVISPLGSEGPEFVPAQVLEFYFDGWNGRPVMIDHPVTAEDQPISANDPRILEEQSVGQIFNTTFVNNALRMEGWIDVEKCERLGGDALDLLTRMRASEIVEVSIGATVTYKEVPGSINGKSFTSQWVSISPDHLALLSSGTKGACNANMGCGVRAAAASQKELKRKLILALANKGPSDQELRDSISFAIRQLPLSQFEGLDSVSVEFWGIVDVYQESSTVVSVFWTGETQVYFIHKYSRDKSSGLITLIGLPEKGEYRYDGIAEFVTLSGNVQISNMSTLKEPKMDECPKKPLIDALIIKGKAKEEDRLSLASLTVEILSSLAADPVETNVPAVVAESESADSEQSLPVIEVPQSEWQEVKAAADAYHAAQKREREKLITVLRGKTEFSDSDLNTLSIDALTKLSATMKKLSGQETALGGNFQFLENPSAEPKFEMAPRPFDNINKGAN